MKSTLAAMIAVAVLAAGAPVAAMQQQALPRWICTMFPMFCND